jgi:hypothetical protein
MERMLLGVDPGDHAARDSVVRAVRNARLQASTQEVRQDLEDLWRDAKSPIPQRVYGVLELGAALPELGATPTPSRPGCVLLGLAGEGYQDAVRVFVRHVGEWPAPVLHSARIP